MEEAQTKQHLMPAEGALAAPKEAGVRDWVIEIRAQEVGAQTFGRLIGHLDTWVKQTQATKSGRLLSKIIKKCNL